MLKPSIFKIGELTMAAKVTICEIEKRERWGGVKVDCIILFFKS